MYAQNGLGIVVKIPQELHSYLLSGYLQPPSPLQPCFGVTPTMPSKVKQDRSPSKVCAASSHPVHPTCSIYGDGSPKDPSIRTLALPPWPSPRPACSLPCTRCPCLPKSHFWSSCGTPIPRLAFVGSGRAFWMPYSSGHSQIHLALLPFHSFA